jgi:hypothetical protein
VHVPHLRLMYIGRQAISLSYLIRPKLSIMELVQPHSAV